MKIRLFCLPYAGGSAMNFCKYKRYLDKDIILHPIELAGRGRKIKIPFYDSLIEAVDDIYNEIESELDNTQFAFWGHSLGSILTYETVLRIMSEKNLSPVHIFVSASRPPHLLKNGKIFHTLPDDEFIKEIISMGGTDKAVFENDEISRYFIKLLKSDFKMIETYVPTAYRVFNFPITAMCGKDDAIPSKEIYEWNKYTTKNYSFYEFEGGHFYINSETEKTAKIINETFKPYLDCK